MSHQKKRFAGSSRKTWIDRENKKENHPKFFIFFDAEGTLYIPKTGHSYSDFWDKGPHSLERAKNIFKLDRKAKAVLRELRKLGIPMYIMSIHDETILPGLLNHFKIKHFFEDILINGDKGARISTYTINHQIPTNRCIMVGDRPEIDIIPVKMEGISTILIDREYNKDFITSRINNLDDLIKLLI